MTAIFATHALKYANEGTEILHGIDLTVQPGEYVTIAGPSGSGKSTFLRLLATLITPTGGEINYNGRPQASYEKIAYRREVSYCFQQPSLFGTTVQDNLAFPFAIRNVPFDAQRATKALAAVDLTEDFLPKPVEELSGGEKQRIALIRNVLFLPKVLLLDEVTTGLDADTKNIVHHLIESLNQKQHITILAVTHDEGEIAVAHRLINLVAGQLEVEA